MFDFGEQIRPVMEGMLLELHTSFIGEVFRVSDGGSRASVQPLTLMKLAGEAPKKQPPLERLCMLEGVTVEKGDIVLCVCCERDISRAVQGQYTLPGNWHHAIGDAVIVGRIRA